ncbi:MAG: hypothetical protein WA919_16550 [Coleofasciculaceae cyanobacterium]
MLVFIVPLKSAKVSKSWKYVCQIFERCVRSICSQTDSNFRVVVVCHEKPNIQFNHPHLHYIEVDFPLPEDLGGKRRDKAKKTIKGLMYARQFSPTHIMVADPDDCLSRHTADFTNQHPNSTGWFLDKGYVYQEKSPFIYYRKSNFHKWCGTCNIIRADLCPLPDTNNDYPENLIRYYYSTNHKNIEYTMSKEGNPLNRFPFIGAVYIVGHGENVYQTGFSSLHNANRGKVLFQIKEMLKFRPIIPSIRNEFGLYQIV